MIKEKTQTDDKLFKSSKIKKNVFQLFPLLSFFIQKKSKLIINFSDSAFPQQRISLELLDVYGYFAYVNIYFLF